MSLTIRIDAMESPAREVFRECYDLFAEALVIPNKWLPRRLQRKANMRLVSDSGRAEDWHKEYGVTPASIFRDQRSRMERKQQRESAYAALNTDKAERVLRYRESCDHPDGIEYDISREELIQQAERAFDRLLKKMESFDGSSLPNSEFLKKLRD